MNARHSLILAVTVLLCSLCANAAFAQEGVYIAKDTKLWKVVDGGLVEAGKRIFMDDFSKGITSDWKLDAAHMWKIEDNTLANTKYGGNIKLEKDLGEAFVVEVKMKPIQNDPERKHGFTGISVSGIMFSTQDHRWWWHYRRPGAKRSSGQWKIEKIPFGRWYNHKIIRRAGGTFEWYVDGRKICDIVEPEMKGGLALHGWRIKSAYDDIRVYKIEDKTSQVDAKGINLARNASFENVHDNLPPYWAPGLGNIPFSYGTVEKYWKSWRPDTSEKYHGATSMRLSGHKNNSIHSILINTRKGQPYTFSLYLKSDEADVPVYFTMGGARAVVKVGKTWKQYSVTADKINSNRIRMFIRARTSQTVWMDAVQLEAGTSATAFRLNPLDRRKKYEIPKVTVADTIIPKVATPPVIDGRLNDKAWSAAAVAPTMRVPTGLPGRFKAPENKTEARLCHDADNLYMSFKCFVPSGKDVEANARKRPETVWGTDSVEIFIDTNFDRKTYYHLACNVIGVKHDAKGGDTSWNLDWRVKGIAEKNFWTVEIAIPLADLEISPLTGASWGINLGRGRACTAPAMNNKGMYFHAAQSYSVFKWEDASVFKKYLCSAENLRLTEGRNGTATLSGEIKNLTGNDMRVSLEAKLNSKKLTMKPMTIAHSRTEPFTLSPFAPLKKGEAMVTVRISDSTAGKLVRATTTPVRLVSPLKVVVGRSYYTSEKIARAHIRLSVSPEILKGVRIGLELKKGGSCVYKSERKANASAFAYDIPLGDVPVGEYSLLSTLSTEGGKKIASTSQPLRKLKPIANEVKIDRISRALLVNGKRFYPFSPLQVFHQPRQGAYGKQDEVIEKMMAYWAGLGFKSLLLGTNIDRPHSARTWDKVFDAAHENGIKIIVFWTGASSKVLLGDKKKTREFVLRWKDKPALLAWMPEDEPEIKPINPEELTAAILEFKRLDPYHPVYINYTMMGPQSRYGGLPGDIMSIDHYLTSVEGRTIRETMLYVDQMKAVSDPRNVPVWNIIVGNNLGNHTREISAGEQEAQTYANIIKGVTGLQYFLGQLAGRQHWKRFLSLNKEIEQLSPVIFSVEPVGKVTFTPTGLLATTRKLGDKVYLLAVNIEPEGVDAVFDISSLTVGPGTEVKVVFENRKIKTDGNILRDKFTGFQRHVYEMVPTGKTSASK